MKAPWFRFFPGDWLRGADLRLASVAARGVWIDLICHMHEANPRGYLLVGGKAPNVQQIAKMLSSNVSEIAPLLDELDSLGVLSRDENGVIFNRRMAREGEISDIRSYAGKQGGRPMKKQNESKTKANGKQTKSKMRKQNESSDAEICQSKPLEIDLLSRFSAPAERAIGIEETIYAAYPRKVGKPAAIRAIQKALKSIDGESLLELTRAYAEARKSEDPQFTPHPATWFNGQRWADDPSTWRTNGTTHGRNATPGATGEAGRIQRSLAALAEFVDDGDTGPMFNQLDGIRGQHGGPRCIEAHSGDDAAPG